MLNYHLFFYLLVSIGFLTKLTAEEPSLMQKEIKHVVVVMLENRSFDNVLAWLYESPEAPKHFIPSHSEPLFYGLSKDTLNAFSNVLKDSKGNVLYSCPPIKGIPSVSKSYYINSPQFDPHEGFPNVQNQIYGFEGSEQPTMNGFLQDYASFWSESDWISEKTDICAVMETYTPKELPILYGLAKHYAVSDLWFSSVPTQTNPNRGFALCGTSEGQIINQEYGASVFESDTLWNRLSDESPNTSWAIFWQSYSFPLFSKTPYCKTTYKALDKIPNIEKNIKLIDQFHELARSGNLPDFSFIEPQWTLTVNIDPKVSWQNTLGCIQEEYILFGVQGNDLHPPGDMRTGENLLANIYTSLCSNQEAWNHTLLVITFDEHGGLFDHIAPPEAIAPDTHFENNFLFNRYGVRVPALFISPRIQKKTVLRSGTEVPFDHTSLISTLLQWKHIPKDRWNMGNRAAQAPTFDAVITLNHPRTDSIVTEAPIQGTKSDIVSMGDPFYLRNSQGDYIVHTNVTHKNYAIIGRPNEKMPLKCVGGLGNVTHGSFVQLSRTDDARLLTTSRLFGDCFYEYNFHGSRQWWTIKSIDHPYLASAIRYGDKVYFENHIYLDPLHYFPGRLSNEEGRYCEYLKSRSMGHCDSHKDFWIIERAH